MTDKALQAARRAEHQQRMQVRALREQVFQNQGLEAQDAVFKQLAAAELALNKLEEQRISLENQNGPPGVLLDTQKGEAGLGGIMLGPETTGIDVRVLLRQSHIPTGIVHQLKVDETPLVTFQVSSTADQYVRLRLISFVEEYSAQAIDTLELPPGESVQVNHLPTFFPEKIGLVNEVRRASLHIRVDDLDGATEQHSTFPVWLLSRNSVYNGIKHPATNGWIDLLEYLAAWVTPNFRPVLETLRQAAELHPQKKMVGYHGSAAQVEQQVKAIYQALKERGILYINSTLAFGSKEEVSLQRVRLPRQSLMQRSANCVDGTLLMASLLEAASLNPGLVIVPGHAFLAWETQNGNGEWDYLETTMISTHDFADAQIRGRILAEQYQEMAQQAGDEKIFRRLSLLELRAERGIMPME